MPIPGDSVIRERAWPLTVYLIKPNFVRDSAILADSDKVESQAVGRGRGSIGRLYYRRANVRVPRWTDFFGGTINTSEFKSASTPAILIVRVSGRVFAVAFGHARFMLQPGCYEENFGLRVTLNAADPERVAALDRDFLEFLTTWNTAEEPGRTAYTAEYLLVTARRR